MAASQARPTTGTRSACQTELLEHPGDVPVKLGIEFPDQTVWIAPKETYKIEFGPELATSIEGILGHGSIRESYQGPVA